ncbi:MAG TPA: tail fiber domain-containing protein, partial [Allocoleopsis sp.]
GTYSGVGRWGLFMEPGAITIGKPTGAGKNFKVSNYNADSTKSDLLTVDQDGILSLTNTTASTSSSTGSITTPGGIGISKTTNASSVSNGGSFTTAGGMAVAQDLYIGGVLYETSDLRLKENIKSLDSEPLPDINLLNPVKYTKKGFDRTEIGLIAQELKEIFPEFVNGTEEIGYSIDYQKLSVLALLYIKQLNNKINSLLM